MKTENASFKIQDYTFEKVILDNSRESKELINLDFKPTGAFDSTQKTFELTLEFLAFDDVDEESVPKINIIFKATFSFTGVEKLEEIPDFFYRNAIAIVFPYIRSFVSTLTLQSNSKLIILPTMNLGRLEKPLREKTITI